MKQIITYCQVGKASEERFKKRKNKRKLYFPSDFLTDSVYQTVYHFDDALMV